MSKERKDNCYKCKHKKNVPGNAHIKCENPDPDMKGVSYGIKNGWFSYPYCFDPVWKDKECVNFEEN